MENIRGGILLLKSIVTKISTDLEIAQKGARSRTWTLLQITNAAETIEEKVKDLPVWAYKYLTFSSWENVANSYKSAADTTKIEFAFNGKGEVNKVKIYRGNASHVPHGACTNRLSIDISKVMTEEFNIDIKEDNKKQDLARYMLKSIGFTPSGNKDY